MSHRKDATAQRFAREMVDAVYRADSRRVLATLIRLLGDFDRAEEAMHDAFAAAVEQWPREGLPDNPRAWLVSAGRFKAIDAMRRRARFDAALTNLEPDEHEARASYERALELVRQEPERRFLERRLREIVQRHDPRL
jgi:RNA polymerase sigma-70 factor (ECF subfamily)